MLAARPAGIFGPHRGALLSDTNGWDRTYVDRRDFLKYSMATGAVVWAGSLAPGVPGIGQAEAQEMFEVSRVDPRVFPQSVASGDPRPDGIVLWTRLAPRRGGKTKVAYEVARVEDESFEAPVLRGVAETDAGRDYTVKVQLERPELEPFRGYRYRFVHRGASSRTGRFMTLPAPDAEVSRLRFGYISCQDYTNGYYNALGYLAEEDVDYIVHLGDYIYETVDASTFQGGGPEERRITLPDSGDPEVADTLEDYRFLYKKYRTDRNLQKVHENFAFITIWDDHEFTNDNYGISASDGPGDLRQPERRSAANRAWAEYTPAGISYEPAAGDPLEEIRIYRSFAFGDLMELVMTDERLYRDAHPCGEETADKYLTPGCEEIEAPDRTMLGAEQKEYFLEKITGSPRMWKLWGNETMIMQLKLANTYLGGGADSVLPEVEQSPQTDGVYVSLDQWDGYGAEQREIPRRVREAGTENFVVITGDIHSFVAGYVKEDYDDPANEPPNAVGTAFVCGSVTSSNLNELALGADNGGAGNGSRLPLLTADAYRELQSGLNKSSNPHFEFFNSDTHGYNLMELTKQELVCTMKEVSTIQEPEAELKTLAQFRVPAGSVEISRTDLPVQPSTL